MTIEEILPCYEKSLSPERMAGSIYWPEAPKQPFPHIEVLGLLVWIKRLQSTSTVQFINVIKQHIYLKKAFTLKLLVTATRTTSHN